MGVQERKQRQRENLKSRILETAREIATKDGWEAVSMRRIAESIEYTAPVIYSHFEDKDALLKELVGEGFRLLTGAAQEARLSQSEPAARLRAVAMAYWRFAFENPEYYQVMFNLQGVICKSAMGLSSQSGESTDPFVATVVDLLRSKGSDENAEDILHEFFSLLHGFVSFTMAKKFWTHDESEKHMTKAVERFIKSI